jgi:hypothetical protein
LKTANDAQGASHVRRGLLRLYLVVAVPWVAWFGYQLIDALRYHPRYVSGAFWSLLIVPIGAPLIFVIVVWVLAGFQRSLPENRKASAIPKSETEATPPVSHRSMTEYCPVIARAVASLADNTPEARQAVYDRARSVLITQLHGQDHSQIMHEQNALEAAIEQIEADALPRHSSSSSFWGRKDSGSSPLRTNPRTREPLIATKASTVLLIVSLFFPRIWLIDLTCMSLWWVARLPSTKHRVKIAL